MSTDHKQAAIEAGSDELAVIIDSIEVGEWHKVRAGDIINAALPHLRAMIAQEILSGTNTFIVPPTVRYHDFKSGHATARADAARIAKGPQQ